jgi:hypothetical protein
MMSLITESSRILASIRVFWMRSAWLAYSRTSRLRAANLVSCERDGRRP